MNTDIEKYYHNCIERYCRNCGSCGRNDRKHDKTPGLLKPLPIPEHGHWRDISMDGKDMPKDRSGHDYVWIFVCRFSKRGISLPGYKTDTAEKVAKLYYNYIWRIYGSPESIVCDRGPQFAGHFADELCKLLHITLKIATSGHPQTDGNSEIYIQHLISRLRHFVSHHQDDWSDYLPAMDFAQAMLPHDSTGLSPYETEFGAKPRMHWDWEVRTKVQKPANEEMARESARQFAIRRELAWEIAKDGLRRAQERQQKQANRSRREPDFEVGDLVYLDRRGLQIDQPSLSLTAWGCGPFPIIGMKGHSYELDLPEGMNIHPVFYADRL